MINHGMKMKSGLCVYEVIIKRRDEHLDGWMGGVEIDRKIYIKEKAMRQLMLSFAAGEIDDCVVCT